MSAVTVQLPPDTEQKLRDRATRVGQSLEVYLRELAERAVATSADPPRLISDPRPTGAEFERLLGELATGPSLPVLPTDFSRADIYDDHD